MPIKSKKTPRGGKAVAIKEAIPRKPRGPYKTRPVNMSPKALWETWDDPEDFQDAFALHIRRYGENVSRLHKALALGEEIVVMSGWCNGVRRRTSGKTRVETGRGLIWWGQGQVGRRLGSYG
jgi:hypothetical protein